MRKGSNRGSTIFCRYSAAMALLCVSCLSYPRLAVASELSGIATLASQYIYRGQAVSDGDPAIQLGLDYEHDSGLFAGIWASTIDLKSNFSERDAELDYYVGYHYAPDAPVALTATLVRYTYPGQTATVDYNYNEALVTVTLNGRHSAEFGYTTNLYGLGRIGRHWELRSEWPVAGAWVISAGLGRNDLADFATSPYAHWDLGASARFSRLTVDIRWHDNEPHTSGIGGRSAGSQIVVSLSAAF